MKSFIKGLLIDMLIVCIPCAFAAGLIAGCYTEIGSRDRSIAEIVMKVREVPEYSKVEVWYEVPSKGIWLGLLTVDILSGTIEEVKEPMKGYWQGRRRLKAVGYRTGGGMDEIQLCQSMNSNSNSDNK